MSDHYQTVCNAFEDGKDREFVANIYRSELWNRVESGEMDTDTAISTLQERLDRETYLQELKESKQGTYGKVPELCKAKPKLGGCNGLSHEQFMERQAA